MVKVKNLLYQPLVLDFGKNSVVRINGRETVEVKDAFIGSPVFERNAKDLEIIAQPKTQPKEATDVKPKK